MNEENNMAETFVAINKDESSNVTVEQASPEENKSTLTLSKTLVAKRRKQGRPKKYREDVIDMPSPLPSAESSIGNKKRGRGRPKGSSQKPRFMGCVGNITGGFTAHVLEVVNGEDIICKIISVARSIPRSICVLSAQGSVSTAVIRQPCGVYYKYEGRFGIISLSGGYVAKGGSLVKTGEVSVSLCMPDSTIFGGSSVASLVADGDVQVTLGSYKQDIVRNREHCNDEENEEAMNGPDNMTGVHVVTAPNMRPTTQIVYDAEPISFRPPSTQFFSSNDHQCDILETVTTFNDGL